jgi:hypothetical protein
MVRSHDEPPNLERALRWLLYDLCVDGGYCIPSDATDAIAQRSSITAGEFARAVLEAEGMNPDYEKKALRAVRARFIERFGECTTARDYEIAK